MNSRDQFESYFEMMQDVGEHCGTSLGQWAKDIMEATWDASRSCATPDWQHAPQWANWLAMDAEGQWFWFAEKPTPSTDFWINPWGKRVKEAGLTPGRSGWIETLEPRP